MKIALLNDKLDAGGAEKVLVNMANMLHSNGIDVSVVLFLGASVLDSLINPAIPIHYLHRKGRFDVKAMFALKKVVKGFDIVHVHSRYNLRYYFVAKAIAGSQKPKVVFHEHIPILSVNWFTKFCLQKSDAYIAVLQSMTQWAKDSLQLKPTKVFYLPNTINTPKENIARQAVGYKIIMVGNIWHFKNQLFAVDLINALPEAYTLDIYGSKNDKDYYGKLMDKINESGLQKRVKIIEGVSDIYAVLGDYNFAIHTSPHETGPLVLLEYMHAGLPFLTYKTGDVAANILEKMPEAIVDSFDISSWKNAIDQFMLDANRRLMIRAKMDLIIEEKYAEKIYFQQLNHIYSTINLN